MQSFKIYQLIIVIITLKEVLNNFTNYSVVTVDEWSYFNNNYRFSWELISNYTAVKTNTVKQSYLLDIKKNEFAGVSFISNNFDFDDITIHKDSQLMFPGKDYFYQLNTSDYLVPKARFSSNATILTNTSVSLDNDDINICNLSGGGINFTSKIYTDTDFVDINSFGNLAFTLNKQSNGIQTKTIKDYTMSLTSLDNYIKNINSKYSSAPALEVPTDGIKFKDIMILNQINIDGGHLVGISAFNEVFIWNITQVKLESGYETFIKYYATIRDKENNDNPFDNLVKLGFYNDYIIFGYKGEGIEIFYTSDTDYNSNEDTNNNNENENTDNTDNTNNNDNTNPNDNTDNTTPTNPDENVDNGRRRSLEITYTYNSKSYSGSKFYLNSAFGMRFDFVDFIVNKLTMYVIEKSYPIKIFDFQGLTFGSYEITTTNTDLQKFEYLEYSEYNDSHYIGVSATNYPPVRPEFFYEINYDDEYRPSINRIYISLKKRRYDNFVTNLSSLTAMFDKENKELVLLIRGAPNIINIPSFVIPIKNQEKLKFQSENYPIHIVFDENDYDFSYLIADGSTYISFTDFKILPYNIVCNFKKKGQYDLNLDFITSCDETNNDYTYCIYRMETIFVIAGRTSGLVALLIILLIILFGVVAFLILVKYGIICKDKKSQNPSAQRPGNYQNPNGDDNTNKVDLGEIEIQVQHQQLQDE